MMMMTVAKQAASSRDMYNGVLNAAAATATLAEKRIVMLFVGCPSQREHTELLI